jgi:hypothetical protein
MPFFPAILSNLDACNRLYPQVEKSFQQPVDSYSWAFSGVAMDFLLVIGTILNGKITDR